MVKLTQTQMQILSHLSNSYYVEPLYRRHGNAIVYETDYGPTWTTCYVGFVPPDPGAVPQRVPGQVSLLTVESAEFVDTTIPLVMNRLTKGDHVAVQCPAEGVFWACGIRAIDRIARPADTQSPTHVITCDYVRFEPMVNAIISLDLSSAAIAFLSGSHGEWTMADDVRRAKQKRQARQPRRAKPKPTRARMALSHCAQKYARAIADPFNPVSVGACVPVYPAPPSYKVTAHQRVFTVTVGSMGIGCCRFNPTPYADKLCIAGTTSAFDGTTLEDFVANSEWTSAGFSTLPFTSSDNVQARVVSACLRVTYTGTSLDLSGMFVSMVDPDHNMIPTNLDLTAASALPYARVENTKRRMNNLSPVFGVKPHETDYLATTWPLSGYSGSTNADGMNRSPCAFIVSGVPGTTFNVELIQHVEYIGRPAVAGLTKSHTDSRGFEMVQQAGSQLASYLASSATAAWPTMRRLLIEAGRDVLSAQFGVRVPRLEL